MEVKHEKITLLIIISDVPLTPNPPINIARNTIETVE